MTENRKNMPSLSELGGHKQRWLFDSPAWLDIWWRCFGDRKSELLTRDSDGEANGVSRRVYVHRKWVKFIIPLKRVELVGNSWNTGDACPSEFNRILPDVGGRNVSISEWLDKIKRTCSWHELIIANWHLSGADFNELTTWASANRCKLMVEDIKSSYFIHRQQSWEHYLSTLSGNTRRRVINHRIKFGSKLSFEFVDKIDVSDVLDELDRMLETRFGRFSYTDKINEFFKEVGKWASSRDLLRLSVIKNGERIVSVLYSIEFGDDWYFLRLGFDSDADLKTSLGLLHLGYQIERSLGSAGRFWLLSGSGATDEYKSKIGDSVQIGTVRLIRSYWLARGMKNRRRTNTEWSPSQK